ncbi:MAG: type II toxin-antitoxin system VapC family toxin [Candidatus Freyarchaeota archaeon]|nr:type II toxin-antitoxin system VapC family toxin [Candidatus Jordarchaeia archaeon]
MITYLVDASVACRFLLVEDLSGKAELVLSDFVSGSIELAAPRLIICEVGNTLRKAVKRNLIEPSVALDKMVFFLKLGIRYVELGREAYVRTLAWSIENDATYYDGVYVICSKETGATLLTADNTLYEKAKKEVKAVHLKDYHTS